MRDEYYGREQIGWVELHGDVFEMEGVRNGGRKGRMRERKGGRQKK